ncbi:hypothetical protein Peur_021623 [Populus x canadensis]
MILGDVGVDNETKNTSNEDVNLREGSRVFEEDSIPNFVNDVNNMITGVNVSVSTSNSSSIGKRKATQNCSGKSFKTKKGSGMGAQLFSRLDKLIDNVSIKSDCIFGFMDMKRCSIEEVMAEFHFIYEVVF